MAIPIDAGRGATDLPGSSERIGIGAAAPSSDSMTGAKQNPSAAAGKTNLPSRARLRHPKDRSPEAHTAPQQLMPWHAASGSRPQSALQVRKGISAAANEIGRSPALVSQVLRKRYPGDRAICPAGPPKLSRPMRTRMRVASGSVGQGRLGKGINPGFWGDGCAAPVQSASQLSPVASSCANRATHARNCRSARLHPRQIPPP